MNLSDCLLNQEVSILKDLASTYECECNRNSKLDMVQSVYHRLFHKKSCRMQMEGFSDEWFYFFTFLLFQRQTTFTMPALLGKGKRIGSLLALSGSPKTWLANIIRKGWLFPIKDRGQSKWMIPTDLQSFLRHECKQVWLSRMGYVVSQHNRGGDTQAPVIGDEIVQRKGVGTSHSGVQPSVIRDEGSLFFSDLHIWLQFVHDEYIPLTKQGVMFKRTQKQLMDQLHIPEDTVNEKEWRFGYGRRFPFYPNRFALIYDFSYEQGWVNEGMGELYLTHEGVGRLKEKTLGGRTDEWQDCLRFYIRTYQKPIPVLAFLVRWIIFTFLDQWVRVDQLYEIVSPWLTSYYFDDQRNIFDVRIMQMFSHLGMIQTAYDKENDSWFVRRHPHVSLEFFL